VRSRTLRTSAAIGDLTGVYGPDETHPYWQLEGVDARGQVTEALEGGGADTVTQVYDAATGEERQTGVEDGSTWILHQDYNNCSKQNRHSASRRATRISSQHKLPPLELLRRNMA
jgi:hypothetical protein